MKKSQSEFACTGHFVVLSQIHWSSKVRFCKFATDSEGRCEGQRARAAMVVCLFGA